MEFWAQRTISPVDGREGWTVVDERCVEHAGAGEWLRVLVDGEGRSVGTARAYAGRVALYLTWAASVSGVDGLAPTVEQLACFAGWLGRTPSRKHRWGRDRRVASQPAVVTMSPARAAATVDGILIAVVEFVRFAACRGWTGMGASRRARFRGGASLPAGALGPGGGNGAAGGPPPAGASAAGGAGAGDVEPR
jgi:integrase/recombinase XerD